MTRQYEIFVTVNPTMMGQMQGVSMAAQSQIKQALGPDLVSYTPVARELIARLEVDEKVDINRILNVEMYRAVYPSISKIEAVLLES